MDRENELNQAKEILKPWTIDSVDAEGYRSDITIKLEDMLESVEAIKEAGWGYLVTMSGLDHGPDADKMELLIHFSENGAVLTLRIALPREGAVVPTLCDIYPYAHFAERETMEMFGITFENTPIPEKLFLPEGWPDGQYPLKKDWDPASLHGSQQGGE